MSNAHSNYHSIKGLYAEIHRKYAKGLRSKLKHITDKTKKYGVIIEKHFRAVTSDGKSFKVYTRDMERFAQGRKIDLKNETLMYSIGIDPEPFIIMHMDDNLTSPSFNNHFYTFFKLTFCTIPKQQRRYYKDAKYKVKSLHYLNKEVEESIYVPSELTVAEDGSFIHKGAYARIRIDKSFDQLFTKNSKLLRQNLQVAENLFPADICKTDKHTLNQPWYAVKRGIKHTKLKNLWGLLKDPNQIITKEKLTYCYDVTHYLSSGFSKQKTVSERIQKALNAHRYDIADMLDKLHIHMVNQDDK